MKNEKITSFAALVKQSMTAGTLVSLTFHAPTGGDCIKCRGTLRQIGGASVVQFETSLTEGRVSQENVPADRLEDAVERYFDTYRKADLTDKTGNASVMISKKGAVTLLKKGKIGDAAAKSTENEVKNDREKNRLLTGEEAFLKALGVSDGKGRIHDKKQSKFRQICRFSEYIVEAEKKLNREGTLYVCDLCCGKSYLSFAAYHVLTAVCGRDVKMTCVDLKQSVMDFCNDVAKTAGMTGMEFLCMNIDDFTPERAPDLVISLHACDIATDIVLSFASRHRADVILSTPCCHHRLNNDMDCPELDFIADRSILRQKLATAATDALRLLKLEAEGYKTDATELIDPEDTPKNVMLRGVRRKNFRFDSDEARQKREKYTAAYRFFYGKDPDEKLFVCYDGN
ncbi:MAG: SAM-dependent methyltransferase [Clostridia bacterium]|nr:SAM-dependent methyltransferase [Clostridia bacterium]